MPTQFRLPRRVRFGEFEADLRTGELQKGGARVPLQKQPFEVLVFLLHRAGDLVSRDELQKAIFPDGLNVDFEHGVNRAVSKLRRALEDCADRPRIIETLPGRGYRLIASVDLEGSASKDLLKGPETGSSNHGSEPCTSRAISLPHNGALPLDSPFYVQRETDAMVRTAVDAGESVVLLKGARQTGKTSLLARVLASSRRRTDSVLVTDIQKLRIDELGDIDVFLRAIAENIADRLDFEPSVASTWNSRRSPSSNFERFLREMLRAHGRRLVWAIDEADRIFSCVYANEFFGLMRAWHNERALDPTSHWQHLTIVIVYAAEAHLFITDPNQSPFNVGSKFELQDFTTEHIRTLNRCYGNPVDEDGIAQIQLLVGGHPQLVQRALFEVAVRRHSVEDLAKSAADENGPFSEHLRHLLLSLERRPELLESVRGTLSGIGAVSTDHFYRLRAFGIVEGDSARNAVPRCKLYRTFLSRHLL